MPTNRRSSGSQTTYPPRTDPDPSEDGGVAGSLQRLLFGENPDSSEGGGFQVPPGLPISPEVDYQIASSFYRAQLQAAQTGRQQAAGAAIEPPHQRKG